MSNGFPGFPFGFPAQGFAGGEQSSVTGQRSMKDTGFMAGGNIDFIKMAALVRVHSLFVQRFSKISEK